MPALGGSGARAPRRGNGTPVPADAAAVLAHEVRNALTSVRLDLQLVEEGLEPDSRLRALQHGALEQLQDVERSLGDVLRLARGAAAGLSPIDLGVPLAAALASARPTLAACGAELRAADHALPLPVIGDAAALEKLFLNLLLNAAQAVAPAGGVEVELAQQGGHVTVTVRDSGVGMDATTLERAFEPFFTTKPDGGGVGLALARHIARAHGGELTLESAPGRGTAARLSLPLAGR